MKLNKEFSAMIYKKKKKIIHRKDAPIVITNPLIAEYTNQGRSTICRHLQFNKDTWNNFWLLVQYLESKGLRPERSEG